MFDGGILSGQDGRGANAEEDQLGPNRDLPRAALSACLLLLLEIIADESSPKQNSGRHEYIIFWLSSLTKGILR